MESSILIPGTITLYDGSTVLGTAPLVCTGSNCQATLTLSNLAAGSHTLETSYAQTTNFNASTSNTVTLTVVKHKVYLSALSNW